MKFLASFAAGVGCALVFLYSSGFQFALPNLLGTLFLIILIGTTLWLRTTTPNKTWFPALWIGFIACYMIGLVAGSAFGK